MVTKGRMEDAILLGTASRSSEKTAIASDYVSILFVLQMPDREPQDLLNIARHSLLQSIARTCRWPLEQDSFISLANASGVVS